MAEKWSEVGVIEIDFAPSVTDTNTAEKWKEWAKNESILVKVKTNSTHARNNGEIEIERCNAITDVPIGILRAIVGDPTGFPKKFMARVAVAAWDVNCEGAGTGALADVDFGRKIQPDTDGKASIVTSGTDGYGRVVGGDKADIRLCYDFRDNFR